MYNIRLGYGCGIKATLLTASGEVCDLRKARYKGALLVLPNGSTIPCADVSVDDVTNAMYVRLLGDRELTTVGKYGILFNVKMANGVMYSSPVVMFGEVQEDAEVQYKELNISIAVTVTYLPANVAYTGASPKISPNGTWLVYNDEINAYEDTGEPANYAGILGDMQALRDELTAENITDKVAVDWRTVGKNANGEICVIGGDTEVADYLAGYLEHNGYVQATYLDDYATREWVEDKHYITRDDIPLNVGEFVNDKGYITIDALAPLARRGDTLADYGITNAYTKEETKAAYFHYTKIDGVTLKRDDDGYIYVASVGDTDAGINEEQLREYLNANGYLTAESVIDKFVATTGDQDVKGIKNFKEGIRIGGSLITYDPDTQSFILDGNLIISGEVAMRAMLGDLDVPTIMDALVPDNENLKVIDGVLTFVGNTGEGGGSGIDYDQLKQYLDRQGYVTEDDNIKTATALATSRSLWGRAFDGSQDLTGSLNVTTGEGYRITYNGYDLRFIVSGSTSNRGIWDGTNNSWMLYRDNTKNVIIPEGNVIIGEATSTAKLNVGGDVNVNGGIIKWSPEKKAFVFKGNIVVEGEGAFHASLGDLNVQMHVTEEMLTQALASYLPKTGGALAGNIEINTTTSSPFENPQIMLSNGVSRIGTTTSGALCLYGNTITFRGGSKTALSKTGMTLDASGNLSITGAVTPNTSSDERLKRNFEDINASEILQSLGKVKRYEYVDSEVASNPFYAGKHIGLIYQNVKGTDLDKMCQEREDGFGALNYSDSSFISLLAGVCQEQIELNKELKDEVKELKDEVKELREKVEQLERRG